MKEINVREIKENAVKMISDDWMLISAGNAEASNTMTASWGFMGEMWHKDCAAVVIRPSRHTYKFTEENDCFSLCFFDEQYRDALKLCGSKSGRDIDKVSETGLHPIFENGAMYFEEARLVIFCKKLYADTLKPENFIDTNSDVKWYNDDYHKMYYGEIQKVLIRE